MTRLVGSILALAAALTLGAPRADAQKHDVTSAEVVTAREGAYGVPPGQRRNHAKGTWALGSFVGTPEAAADSRSALFSGGPRCRWWRASPLPVALLGDLLLRHQFLIGRAFLGAAHVQA